MYNQMASSGNLTGLQFSKYFPNHLEYASQVPREYIPPKTPTPKPPKPKPPTPKPGKQPKTYNLSVWPQESINIYPEKKSSQKEKVTTPSIQIQVEPSVSTVSTQTYETGKQVDQFQINPHRQKYPQTDQEIQTDPFDSVNDIIYVKPDKVNTILVKTQKEYSTQTTQTDTFERCHISVQTEDISVDIYPEKKIKRIDFPDPDARQYEKIEPFPGTGTDKPQDQKHPSPEHSPEPSLDDKTSPRAWNHMIRREHNKPRMVVSVIGFYNENVPTFNTKDQFVIEEALREVSKYVGRCGFLFNERNTSFVHRVVKSRYPIDGFSTTLYGYTAADKIKMRHDSRHPETPISESSDYNKKLLDLEIYINKQITINFQDEGEEKDIYGRNMHAEKVRVPVVLLLVNGDLFTLEHVVRALYNDISVVVMKGSGGAAELIASCLKSPKCLKRMSVMFRRRFSEHLYQKLENVIHSILERDYMITVFDLHKHSPTKLWDKMTDGIMLAWSFEKQNGIYSDKSTTKPFGTENIFGDVGETIPKYIVNIEWLSKYELFGGYYLRSKSEKLQKDLFINAVFDNRIDIIRQIFTGNFNLSNDQLGMLYQQSIQQNEDNPQAQVTLIWQKTDPDAYDFLKNGQQSKNVHNTRQATKHITDRLLKGLCCSKIGMVTCCNACHKPAKGSEYLKSEKGSDDILRFAVLTNNVPNAAELWIQSTNPMLTALISSCYLVSMADKAEELFEDALRQELDYHAKLFAKRAETLLEKMFQEDDKLASEALNHVTVVWDHVESPLHFGQQFNLEEFISHTAAQKDASKRLFSFKHEDVDEAETKPKRATSSQDDERPHPSCLSFIKHYWKRPLKIITAPICKFIFHKLLLVTSLIMFSVFLTRDLSYNSISVLEIFVCVFVFGDFVEELFNMFHLDNCRWSPQKIFLHLFNIWNFLAIASVAFYLTGFLMHLFGDEDIMVHIRRIYSIAMFLMYLRLLNALLLTKRFGIIIIMVKEMLVDLMEYLVILVVLLFAAGIVYHANVYPNHTVDPFPSTIDQWRIWSILKIPYWQVYGELYLDTLEGSSESACTDNITIWSNDPSAERCPTGDWITPVFAAFYMMLTNWLLLNIVIAMFSARFDIIRERSEQKWRFYRHSVVITYEHWIPSPINLILRPFVVIYGIAKCPCPCSPCFKIKPKGSKTDMLKKQRDFAMKIIDNEREK